jgi:mono/diheme cytochrome c family protein
MNSMNKALLIALLMTGNTLLADNGTDGVLTVLQADDLTVVFQGEQIYRGHCASCHGSELEGQPDWRVRDDNGYLPAPPHDATGHTWHHADDQLFEITKYGPGVVIGDTSYKTVMPAYKGLLTDNEIVAVLSYIKNSWPAEQREWQEQINGTAAGPLDQGTAKDNKGTLLERLFK